MLSDEKLQEIADEIEKRIVAIGKFKEGEIEFGTFLSKLNFPELPKKVIPVSEISNFVFEFGISQIYGMNGRLILLQGWKERLEENIKSPEVILDL